MTSQIGDLVAKLGATETSVAHRCTIGAISPLISAARTALAKAKSSEPVSDDQTEDETPLAKAVRDRSVRSSWHAHTQAELSCLAAGSTTLSAEASQGLIGALLKDHLFNGGRLAQDGGSAAEFQLPPVTS